MKINKGHYLFFTSLLFVSFFHSAGQVVRTWDYSFNPPDNLEAYGSDIVYLNSGKTISCGYFKSTSDPNTKNLLLITDDNGALIDADTALHGFGYTKIIAGGFSDYFALGTLLNDTTTARNILITKIDSVSLNRTYIVPDSNQAISYDQMDLVLLSNNRIVVGSRMDSFPLIRLSVMCLDDQGNELWQSVDSSFEIKYDLKLLADESGGFFAAGSGSDTGTAEDFIFISHFDSSGNRNWLTRINSPTNFFADFWDLLRDGNGDLWMSGVVMDSIGQVGVLSKLDSMGNVLSNRQVLPHPYQKLVCDRNNQIYGAAVPMNGIDVFTLNKMDSSGVVIDSSNYQQTGYFNSILYDLKMLDDGLIVASGELFVLSFPKSDMFLAVMDTNLNLPGYDIYDSLNLLGESGRAIAMGNDSDLYVCGRLNYENQSEECNAGVVKYQLPIINRTKEINDITNFLVFPNPSDGNFSVRWKSDNRENIRIRIFNSMGMEIQSSVLPGNQKNFSYNLNLPDGFYFIVLDNEEMYIRRKILVVQ